MSNLTKSLLLTQVVHGDTETHRKNNKNPPCLCASVVKISQRWQLGLLLALIVVIALAGCGSNRSADIAPPAAVIAPTATPTLPPAAPSQNITSTQTSGNAVPAAATSLALNFKLSGGAVGFCDELTLDTAGGYVLRRSCVEPPELSGVLAPPDLNSLTGWLQNLAGFIFGCA